MALKQKEKIEDAKTAWRQAKHRLK
jgi:hypothetical protein